MMERELLQRLDEAIGRAAGFLLAEQKEWGEIPADRFLNKALTGPGMEDPSPFGATFAMHACSFIEHPSSLMLRQRATAFLLELREEPGVWRYWAKRSGYRIDADVDDTCCAAAALRQEGFANLAHVPSILNLRRADGLFQTWLRAPGERNDVDLVVNANVLYLLGDCEETLAASDALCRAVAEPEGKFDSHYYVDPLALDYSIARAFAAGAVSLERCREDVLRRLWGRLRQRTDAALPTALALAAAFAFGTAISSEAYEHAERLMSMQRPTGGFERAAFWAGPEPPGAQATFWGSDALTTCLCLEALGRCRITLV